MPSLGFKHRPCSTAKGPMVQPKLTVNAPGDRYEREADAMADQVMRMPFDKNHVRQTQGVLASSIQRKPQNIIQRDENGSESTEVPQEETTALPYVDPRIDWFEMTRPFHLRGANRLLFDGETTYTSIGSVWASNYGFFQTFGLGDGLSAEAANFFTPFTIDAALKRDFPTLGEEFERQADISSFTLSPTLFTFDLHDIPGTIRMPFLNIFGVEQSNPYAPSDTIRRKCAECEEEEKLKKGIPLMRKAESGGGFQAPAGFASSLGSTKGGGSPLTDRTRGFMENAFSADFSKVRVHTDSRAAEMSQGIQAKAFTHGNDIYFNKGQFQPEGTEGKRLLAHELTHVRQQMGDLTTGNIQRDVFSGPTTAGEILTEINRRLDANNLLRMSELVSNFALMSTNEQMLRDGVPLVIRLLEAGLRTEAVSVLNAVSSAWMFQFATNGPLVNMSAFGTGHPIEELIGRATVEEAQGNHAVAIELLKNAFFLAQILLLNMTSEFDTRISQTLTDLGPEGANAVFFGIIHLLQYSTYERLYQAIRNIATFYITRQRQAQLAGNAQTATRYGQLDSQLNSALRDSGTLFSRSTGRGLTVMSTVPTSRDPNPTLLGANAESETIRPLPGTPRPDEIAQHPYYSIEMGALLDTLRGQELLVNEVFQFPEVVVAFPSHTINWGSRGDRVRLWNALYDGLVRQHGNTDALPQLMTRIQRYLENYTFHTEYDIRDFGRSYLSTDFPTDLIGRVARDCGVYAVTVAYEVYRVARHASLDINFRIYTSLDHVILVIIETSQNRHFVVSNDVISAPTAGVTDAEIINSVGSSFAAIGQTRFGVTPVLHNDAGSSALGDRNFRGNLWNQFREIGHRWGLRDRTVTNPDTNQPESLYDRHYRDLRTFNQRALRTVQRMGQIEQGLAAAASAADRLALLQHDFVPLANAVISDVWPLFMRLGECADIATTSRRLARRRREFVFNAGGVMHPFVRMAIMLLRFQQLGGTLAPTQIFFICALQRISMFNGQLQASGLPLPACPASFSADYRQLCQQLTAS